MIIKRNQTNYAIWAKRQFNKMPRFDKDAEYRIQDVGTALQLCLRDGWIEYDEGVVDKVVLEITKKIKESSDYKYNLLSPESIVSGHFVYDLIYKLWEKHVPTAWLWRIPVAEASIDEKELDDKVKNLLENKDDNKLYSIYCTLINTSIGFKNRRVKPTLYSSYAIKFRFKLIRYIEYKLWHIDNCICNYKLDPQYRLAINTYFKKPYIPKDIVRNILSKYLKLSYSLQLKGEEYKENWGQTSMERAILYIVESWYKNEDTYCRKTKELERLNKNFLIYKLSTLHCSQRIREDLIYPILDWGEKENTKFKEEEEENNWGRYVDFYAMTFGVGNYQDFI